VHTSELSTGGPVATVATMFGQDSDDNA
jgi:hypothetical protein